MGVYIKGMEMPTGGRILIVFPSGRVLEVSADETQNIFEESQALPVPPHGRLIDADALMGGIRAHDYPLTAHFNSMDNGMFTIGIQQVVDESPTIIPAEEGE